MNSGSSKVVVVIIILILAFTAGLFIGKNSASNPQMASKQDATKTPAANPIFKMQQAFIQGTITAVNGKNVTVKNAQDITGTYPTSDRIAIYQPTSGTKAASASSDLKLIEANKPVLVTLELTNGQYQITSLYYIPLTSSAK